jgi:hypothetical protein
VLGDSREPESSSRPRRSVNRWPGTSRPWATRGDPTSRQCVPRGAREGQDRSAGRPGRARGLYCSSHTPPARRLSRAISQSGDARGKARGKDGDRAHPRDWPTGHGRRSHTPNGSVPAERVAGDLVATCAHRDRASPDSLIGITGFRSTFGRVSASLRCRSIHRDRHGNKTAPGSGMPPEAVEMAGCSGRRARSRRRPCHPCHPSRPCHRQAAWPAWPTPSPGGP